MTMSPEPKPEPAIPREGVERELCPNCLTGNVPGTNFCQECGGPLSPYAAIGPFERIFAAGHICRKATQRPHRFIVVLGIWLTVGPVAVVTATVALSEWTVHTLLQQLFMLGLMAVCATLIAKTTHNYINRKRSVAGQQERPGQ